MAPATSADPASCSPLRRLRRPADRRACRSGAAGTPCASARRRRENCRARRHRGRRPQPPSWRRNTRSRSLRGRSWYVPSSPSPGGAGRRAACGLRTVPRPQDLRPSPVRRGRAAGSPRTAQGHRTTAHVPPTSSKRRTAGPPASHRPALPGAPHGRCPLFLGTPGSRRHEQASAAGGARRRGWAVAGAGPPGPATRTCTPGSSTRRSGRTVWRGRGASPPGTGTCIGAVRPSSRRAESATRSSITCSDVGVRPPVRSSACLHPTSPHRHDGPGQASIPRIRSQLRHATHRPGSLRER